MPKSKDEPEYSGQQLMKIFEKAIKDDRDEMEKSKPLFKKGEGIEEVPGGNDSALDDIID